MANATPTFAPYVEAKTTQVVVQETKEPSVQELIAAYSKRYKVSASEMLRIMTCENRDFDPKLQSKHIYGFSDQKRNIVIGERERSYGLVQIHLPDNPNVSYAQATNAEFSIAFLARNLSKGKGYLWSCY